MKILDHGEVELIDSMGDDSTIVRSARVSHAANEKTGADPEADFKLIDYMYRNGHSSTFEHNQFTYRLLLPLFVRDQLVRHRTMSFNFISFRYTQPEEVFHVPDTEQLRGQSNHNKQSRGGPVIEDAADALALIEQSHRDAYDKYTQLIDMGVSRELARIVLPTAIYTECFLTVDLNNLFKFLTLRIDDHAQYEIRVYAEAMLTLIEPIVPAAIAAWRTHNGQA